MAGRRDEDAEALQRAIEESMLPEDGRDLRQEMIALEEEAEQRRAQETADAALAGMLGGSTTGAAAALGAATDSRHVDDVLPVVRFTPHGAHPMDAVLDAALEETAAAAGGVASVREAFAELDAAGAEARNAAAARERARAANLAEERSWIQVLPELNGGAAAAAAAAGGDGGDGVAACTDAGAKGSEAYAEDEAEARELQRLHGRQLEECEALQAIFGRKCVTVTVESAPPAAVAQLFARLAQHSGVGSSGDGGGYGADVANSDSGTTLRESAFAPAQLKLRFDLAAIDAAAGCGQQTVLGDVGELLVSSGALCAAEVLLPSRYPLVPPLVLDLCGLDAHYSGTQRDPARAARVRRRLEADVRAFLAPTVDEALYQLVEFLREYVILPTHSLSLFFLPY